MQFKHFALFLLLFGQTQRVHANDFSRALTETGKVVYAAAVSICVVGYCLSKGGYDLIRSWTLDAETYEKEQQEKRDAKRRAKEALFQKGTVFDGESVSINIPVESNTLQSSSTIQNYTAVSENEEHVVYRHEINKILKLEENDLVARFELYQALEIQEVSDELTPHHYIVKRCEALRDHFNGKESWKKETYTISISAQNLLAEHDIKIAKYFTHYGNEIQHVLHKEFVDIVHNVTDLHYSDRSQDAKQIVSTLLTFADAGQSHNHAGHVLQACSFADFCHGLQKLDQQIMQIACDVSCALGRGFVKGGKNYGEKVLHPLEAVENTVIGLAKLVNIMGKTVGKYTTQFVQHSLQDMDDIRQGKVTQWDLLQRDAFACYQTVKDVSNALCVMKEKLDYQTVLLGIEKGAEITTESILTSATLGALSVLSKSAGSGLSNFALDTHFGNLPLDPSTMQAVICYDAALADIMNAGIPAIKVSTDVLAGGLDKAAKLSPGLSLLSQNDNSAQGNLQSGTSGNVPSQPDDPQSKYKIYIDDIGEIDANIANLSQHNKDPHYGRTPFMG